VKTRFQSTSGFHVKIKEMQKILDFLPGLVLNIPSITFEAAIDLKT